MWWILSVNASRQFPIRQNCAGKKIPSYQVEVPQKSLFLSTSEWSGLIPSFSSSECSWSVVSSWISSGSETVPGCVTEESTRSGSILTLLTALALASFMSFCSSVDSEDARDWARDGTTGCCVLIRERCLSLLVWLVFFVLSEVWDRHCTSQRKKSHLIAKPQMTNRKQ